MPSVNPDVKPAGVSVEGSFVDEVTVDVETVRVRIAVAINADGEWAVAGWSGIPLRKHDDELSSAALETLPETEGVPEGVHFIEADVPLPVAVTVKGEVVK